MSSGVMPLYNCAEYVVAAVRSILRQRFHDLELLVVDDGSTDGGAGLLAGVADPRIVLLRGERRVVLAARIRGIEAASHDVIALMDADDISYPERLERQHELLQDPSTVLVGCVHGISHTEREGAQNGNLLRAGHLGGSSGQTENREMSVSKNNPAEFACFYDKYWESHKKEPGLVERLRLEFIQSALKDHVQGSNNRILDLGCGRGWLAPFLSPYGEVTGIDFSPRGIEFANANYKEHGKFLLAGAQPAQLIGANQPFDVVVCSEVVEHVADARSFLFQVASYLKPGGLCILTTPNGNVWREYSQDPRFKNGLQPIERWLRPKRCSHLLREARFQVLRHEGLAWHKFRPGIFSWFQLRKIQKIFKRLGFGRLYARLLLPVALYQVVVARKDGSGAD